MAESQAELPPTEIVDACINDKKTLTLWNQLGERAVGRFAAGAMALATLWQSAWDQGGGDQGVANADLEEVPKVSLMALYRSSTFLPSLTLKKIAVELRFPPVNT
jgi:hypothetical protein